MSSRKACCELLCGFKTDAHAALQNRPSRCNSGRAAHASTSRRLTNVLDSSTRIRRLGRSVPRRQGGERARRDHLEARLGRGPAPPPHLPTGSRDSVGHVDLSVGSNLDCDRSEVRLCRTIVHYTPRREGRAVAGTDEGSAVPLDGTSRMGADRRDGVGLPALGIEDVSRAPRGRIGEGCNLPGSKLRDGPNDLTGGIRNSARIGRGGGGRGGST